MSDCGNVKKVFVPTDESKDTIISPVLTFGVTPVAVEKVRHFIAKDGKNSSEYELRDQWRSGDMAAMKASQLDEMQRDFPQIYKDLLVVRNNNWLPQIKKMLTTPEVELVLVGALHLSGEDSVLKLLTDAGYKVRQL